MFFKRMSFLVLALAIAGVLAGTAISATAAPGHASVVIRHETRGCHSWSVNGGQFAASHSITLRHGGWLTVTNNDVMPHRLVLTSGPALRITNTTLRHMGASVKLTLTKPGIYHFTTKPGEDYMSGVKTIGEDKILKLTVIVS